MKTTSKILITGSTGFVGKKLKYKLMDLGYRELLTPTRYDLDLLDTENTFGYIAQHEPEYVFHCAALVGGIKANMENPYGFLWQNLQMQNNIMYATIENNVEKFLNLGSTCIYPKDYTQPLKEEYLLKDIPEPTNEGYSLAKICGLKLCEYANRQNFGTNFVSLMPCNLYGPGDNFDPETSHVLSATIKKVIDAQRQGKSEIVVWGTGKARRQFIYIDDLIDGMIWAMTTLNKTDTFLNIGPSDDISIFGLTKKVCELVGYTGKIVFDKTKPDGMLRKCADVKKINTLGFKTKTPFIEGLKNTIEYYKEKGDDKIS